MRSLFTLGCQYSAQEVSYRKLLGQLDDKGNVATVARYLELLDAAGLLCGIQKFDTRALASRRSSPRLLVYDTSLLQATSRRWREALTDLELKGSLVESAVGAYLLARSREERFELFWWRDGNDEVDFVVSGEGGTTAIEVKSGRVKGARGLMAFGARHPEARLMVVGDSNTTLEGLLSGQVPLFA